MFPTRQAASVSVGYIYIACTACYTFCHVQETGAKVCVCVCVCVCVYRRGSWSLGNCRLSRMMRQCQDEVCVCVCVCVCASFECHLGSAPGLGFFLPSVGVAFMSAKCVCMCAHSYNQSPSLPFPMEALAEPRQDWQPSVSCLCVCVCVCVCVCACVCVRACVCVCE